MFFSAPLSLSLPLIFSLRFSLMLLLVFAPVFLLLSFCSILSAFFPLFGVTKCLCGTCSTSISQQQQQQHHHHLLRVRVCFVFFILFICAFVRVSMLFRNLVHFYLPFGFSLSRSARALYRFVTLFGSVFSPHGSRQMVRCVKRICKLVSQPASQAVYILVWYMVYYIFPAGIHLTLNECFNSFTLAQCMCFCVCMPPAYLSMRVFICCAGHH